MNRWPVRGSVLFPELWEEVRPDGRRNVQVVGVPRAPVPAGNASGVVKLIKFAGAGIGAAAALVAVMSFLGLLAWLVGGCPEIPW